MREEGEESGSIIVSELSSDFALGFSKREGHPFEKGRSA